MLSEPSKNQAKLGMFFYRDVPFVSQRVRRNQDARRVTGIGVAREGGET